MIRHKGTLLHRLHFYRLTILGVSLCQGYHDLLCSPLAETVYLGVLESTLFYSVVGNFLWFSGKRGTGLP
ncbi:hypothetical protein DL96DRAFT_1631867 [Flagelloscypha sp. PMI_526]|nr:hypothetical protein DL96DRAFT_1631867 [Flagelloscypha sp. PMI_526]